jgi:catalase
MYCWGHGSVLDTDLDRGNRCRRGHRELKTVRCANLTVEARRASGSKVPNALKAFAAAHPEFAKFGDWAKNAPWTGSYAEEWFNSLNSFVFVDGSGAEHVVRWWPLPAAHPVAVSPDELAKRGSDFLEQEIAQRVASEPQRWTMVVTVANPGDPT